MRTVTHAALWQVLSACNYNCYYCNSRKKNKVPRYSVGKLLNYWNAVPGTWWIGLTGGEPFLYPDFIELVAGLAQKHYVHIDTNMSRLDVEAFTRKIDPEKVVYLHCALHPEDEDDPRRFMIFLEQVNYLRQNNFNALVGYVLHPKRINKAATAFRIISGAGIPVSAKPYKGSYSGKSYPVSYDDHTKMTYFWDSPPLEWVRAFKPKNHPDLLCGAGVFYCHIRENGDIYHCNTIKKKIGSIIDECLELGEAPGPCHKDRCGCSGWLIQNGIIMDERVFGQKRANSHLSWIETNARVCIESSAAAISV